MAPLPIAPRTPRHCVILCHPDSGSFCNSIMESYKQAVEKIGHEVVVRDLYRMGFDPVLKSHERPTHRDFRLSEDVAAELELISGTDMFVLVYPIWFGLPPAMVKGYVDRVLGAGFSHRAVESHSFHPVMTGRHMLSFSSSGAAWAWLNEKDAWRSLKGVFDDYLASAFSLASVRHVHYPGIVDGLKARFVKEHLFDVEEQARAAALSLTMPIS